MVRGMYRDSILRLFSLCVEKWIVIVNQSGSGEPQPKGDTPCWFLCMWLGVLVLTSYAVSSLQSWEWTGLVTSDSFSILLQAAYDFV